MYTIVVADNTVQVQRGLLLVAIFVAQDSLEDVVILKFDAGSRNVEAHNVDL